MQDAEIHIGDVLRVREWDGMAKEFEVNENAAGGATIITPEGILFLSDMKYMCGETFTVKERRSDLRGLIYYCSKENIEYDGRSSCNFYVTASMLEPFSDKPEEDYTPLPFSELWRFLK